MNLYFLHDLPIALLTELIYAIIEIRIVCPNKPCTQLSTNSQTSGMHSPGECNVNLKYRATTHLPAFLYWFETILLTFPLLKLQFEMSIYECIENI